MIIGIGLDLVEIDRFSGYKHDQAKDVFTPDEIAYCFGKRYPERHLAARFAAKEAFLKAIGTGALTPGEFSCIEIIVDSSGTPDVKLFGTIAARVESLSTLRCHVTMTHTDKTAAAVVILED